MAKKRTKTNSKNKNEVRDPKAGEKRVFSGGSYRIVKKGNGKKR